MTQDWRHQMERRVLELEHAAALDRMQGATKIEIYESETRMAKWVGCMLAILAVGLLFGLVLARL